MESAGKMKQRHKKELRVRARTCTLWRSTMHWATCPTLRRDASATSLCAPHAPHTSRCCMPDFHALS